MDISGFVDQIIRECIVVVGIVLTVLGALGTSVFILLSIAAVVAWHMRLRGLARATLGAWATITLMLQVLLLVFTRSMGAFLHSIVISAIVAVVLSIVIGVPLQELRAAKRTRHAL